MEDKNGKNPNARNTHHVKLLAKRITRPERCWQGAGAHLCPKRIRHDEKANSDSNDERKSKKPNNNTETSSSGQSSSQKPESKNLFRHDSKYTTICRSDNMSYQILQQLTFTNISRTQMAPRLLSGSSRWKRPTSKRMK